MSKAREENPCRNIGRTRKMRSLIRGGKDSNLPSIGISLIEIVKISMLRGNPRKKIPWEKGEDHQSNVGDARKITCTRISHTKRQGEYCAQHPRGYNSRRCGNNLCRFK
jgi:hypothetical protein